MARNVVLPESVALGTECPIGAEMDVCREVKLFLTAIERRGDGTTKSPIRLIVQLWKPDGTLVAEWDPCRNYEK